jgi:hypothetical protein
VTVTGLQGGRLLPGLRLHCGPAAHADAGGGVLRRPGADHAGLPHEGDVQAEHGRARPLHVPGRTGHMANSGERRGCGKERGKLKIKRREKKED